MRGRSLKKFTLTLSAFALLGACTPEGDKPVLNSAGSAQASQLDVGDSGAGNYLAGRHAQKKRDFSNASRLLGKALEDSPKDTRLLRRTFLTRLADGDIASSADMARSIAATEKSAPIAKLVLVIEAIEKGDLAGAEAALKTFPDRGFSGFMKPLLQAWVLVGQGRGDAAIAALEPLKKQSGLRVLYELHAALITDVAGKPEAAEGHYKLAGDNARRATLRVVQGLGRHLERRGAPDKATALYESYLKENPDSVVLRPAMERLAKGEKPELLAANAVEGVSEALFNIASTMTRQNSAQLALIYGQLSIYLRPDFDLAQMLVAGILEAMDRNEDAIAIYQSVKPTSPLHWSARLRVAGNLEALERDEDAIKLLRVLTKEDPTRPGPLVSLGDLLRSNKRFEESIDAYDRAVDMLGDTEKRHWTILYSRGISLERSRQWSRAEQDFQRALELNPEQPYVLNYLGYSWVDQGINLDRARKMIERAVQLRPNDGYIVDSLGWVLYRLGDFKGAVTQLERAVELRSQDPTINDHLGDAYWRVGRYNEARFQWQRALALKPEADQVSAIEGKILRGLGDAKSIEKDS
ncbi:MAG: tetratricopeptide (TPR) repeat protein [Paracoccaceae bacterium]|jgi:tetratricopeptide (TPR) repeat protein